MTIIYQARFLRQSRYKTMLGYQEWSDVSKFYYVIVIMDGYKLIITPKVRQ